MPSTSPLNLPEIASATTQDDLRPPGVSRVRAIDVRKGAIRSIAVFAVGAAIFGVWGLLARSTSPIILPGPDVVWSRFVLALQDGTLFPAIGTTAGEALAGWAVAAVFALPVGYALGQFRSLEDAVAPYLAGSQAMPVVAIAPLIVVWLGFGSTPKIVVCALITFFPMLATTASGVRGVPRDLTDAARVFGAGPLQTAFYVTLPLASRSIFAGVKVAATLSVTGAVVGEFVSADQGLGNLIMSAKSNFDTPLMFVALLCLVALGALAYTAVSATERVVLRWED